MKRKSPCFLLFGVVLYLLTFSMPVLANAAPSLELTSPKVNNSLATLSPVTTETPETIIAEDIKAQQNHDLNAYLSLRTNNSISSEQIDVIKNTSKDGLNPEVEQAKLVGLKQLPEKLAEEVAGHSMDLYITAWPDVRAYYVAIDYKLKKETRWYYNGVNYRLYILALDNNKWVVVEASMAPINQIVKTGNGFGGNDESKAANIEKNRVKTGKFTNLKGDIIEDIGATKEQLQQERALNNNYPKIAAATLTYYTIPSSIRVYRHATGQVEVVNFYTYLKNVLPNEWISSWPTQSLQAGAYACKMYAWYHVVVYPKGSNFDVYDDTRDQQYIPGTETSTTTQAINTVGGVGMINYDGDLFEAQYLQGTPGYYGTGGTGIMLQYGTLKFAENGYRDYDMCHYYYDNSPKSPNGPIDFFAY